LAAGLIPLGACALWRAAFAVDIQGVLPAALDQPQTHLLLTDTPGGSPIMGQDVLGDSSYDIQCYLDTGTSTVLLSDEVWDSFGLTAETDDGQDVEYNDIGIGGSVQYNVSTPYYVSVAPFSSANDVEAGGTVPPASDYTTTFGPMRMELNPVPADSPEDQLNVAGMPVMQGQVMVDDVGVVNNFDEERTYLYAPGTAYNAANSDTAPGIPQTQYHVRLSYASFDQFTSVSPAGASGPLTGANPFIGPNPLRQLETNPAPDNTPPVSISYNGYQSTGSFLYDTGAAVSFLSTAEAAKMHVAYAVNSQGQQLLDSNGDPYLINTDTGQEVPNGFSVPIEGTGGEIDVAGFYLDSLSIPTVEGDPINFVDAPIAVLNITVQDQTTGKLLTLDGDLGMNFMVASVDLNTFNIDAGAFDWMTFDQPNGLLGLTLTGDEPVDIEAGDVVTASSDSAIGGSGLVAVLAGGTLAVTGSFATTRGMSVASPGGTINVSPGATLTVNSPSMTWFGGTLNVTNTGTLAIALSADNVYVSAGTKLNISSGANVVVSGSFDPFTDSVNTSNHVAIVNNGSLAVDVNSAVAGITGNGALTVGNGTTSNTLQIATGSGLNTVSSLTINANSALDLTNNHLIINYAGSADPVATIRQYLKEGYNGGAWNGPGIDSSAVAADGVSYGLGYADAADAGNPAHLASGTIEIAFTLLGDANLDGVVNGIDFGILAANFNHGASAWDQGDFNYDGVVNGIDFGELAANFNHGAGAAAWESVVSFAQANGLMADLPEPLGTGLMVVAIGGAMLRRRGRGNSIAI
jgi:hypothetical protein